MSQEGHDWEETFHGEPGNKYGSVWRCKKCSQVVATTTKPLPSKRFSDGKETWYSCEETQVYRIMES